VESISNLNIKKLKLPNQKLMENHQHTETSYSPYYILAAICGALTALAITTSIPYILLGSFIGLLAAIFFVTALVKNREN
jgi:hypothetical protein